MSSQSDELLLKECAETLVKIGCQFWACDGYEGKPESMLTCDRCWMLHRIYAEHPEWNGLCKQDKDKRPLDIPSQMCILLVIEGGIYEAQ